MAQCSLKQNLSKQAHRNFVWHYFRLQINTHSVPSSWSSSSAAAGQCSVRLTQDKLQRIMKANVTRCKCVAHRWLLNSSWTTARVYGREEKVIKNFFASLLALVFSWDLLSVEKQNISYPLFQGFRKGRQILMLKNGKECRKLPLM